MAYYHPRTGSEATPNVEYARILESTSREVRRLVSAEHDAPIMPRGVKTLHDLLFKVILNRDIPVEQILTLRASDTVRELPPQTFEGMWKVVFALGLVPGYENVRLYKGKVEEGLRLIKRDKTLQHLANPEFNSLATSSKSGASDISLGLSTRDDDEPSGCGTPPASESEVKKSFVFCSSKFYKAEEKKSVDDYDVTNIIAAANHAGYTDDQFRIVLLVKNKEVVKGKFASAYRRYITYIVRSDDERDGVLGREDLEAAITRLRERVGDRTNPEEFIQTKMLGGTAPPAFLSLRFHQELIVRKTLEIHASGEHDSVLWGVVARGGKTYICGGLIRDMRPRPKHIFIVAGAYTETHTQFLDELLDTKKNGFQDFDEYTTVDVKNDEFEFDSEKKYIFFISAELLKAFVEGTTGKKARERMVMSLVQKNIIKPELVFFDEVHKGGTTTLADDAMSLIAGSAFKVFMTATYNKLFIKDEYHITQDNFLTWGYEDIQAAKGIESDETLDYFETKYGKDLCQGVIASQRARGVSLGDIARQYQKFPEIQFLTTSFSDKFRDSMQKQNILDPTAGFRMSTLLAIGKKCGDVEVKKRYRCFSNPASVAVLLNYIAPSTVQMERIGSIEIMQTANPSENIMNRIGRTSQRRDDILKNVHTEFRPHSQLWFLPQPTTSSDDTPLISMMTALASLIMKHPWFSKHFCVVVVSSGFARTEVATYDDGGFIAMTDGGRNTKQTVLDLEKKAYAMGRGLIILAGKMLTLGVSLPCVNVVALLDDSQSSDLTYQKMFRALTESEGKKVGYVVDVNPLRTLKTLYDYTKVEHSESDVLEDKVNATILTNLYLIDEDQLFVTKEDGKRLMPDDLHAQIEKYLQAGRKTYKSIVDEASKNISEVDLTDELTALRADLGAVKARALGVAEALAEVGVPSGVEVVKEKKSKKTPAPTDDTREKLQALREMILTTMTLLAFLTTFTTFDEALEYYRANTDNIQDVIYNVLVDRGLTKSPDKTKIRDVLIVAISKVHGQLARPYGKMRAKLSDLSGDQKEVIEFIEQNLRPKKEQVASRGEVFTHLELVEDMLDHLPEDVWKHPEYKWLDPANGIGNFPVVAFAKLDRGLQEAIPDPTTRRRHIVENMLYMVELDNANIMLSRRLLEKMCGTPDCRFNLIKQDFLVGDYRELFRVDGFDVCMGNPPYNPPKTETGSSGNAIWQNFVMKMESMLKDGGHIVVVHPPGWKKPTEDEYNPLKFRDNNFKGQIRQGQVWQYLRTRGSFQYIYTNDQRSKTLEYWTSFPAVDYYVFKKGETGGLCNTRNIFRGKEYVDVDVPLNTPYLPCLITKETMAVLERVIMQEGPKAPFQRYRAAGGFSVDETKGSTKYIYTFSKTGEPKYQYSDTVHSNVNSDKVVVNFDGGIDYYAALFVPKEAGIGSYDKSMYTLVTSPKEGKHVEQYFKSDIVRFVFLITQYASGQRTQNEVMVANSLTIPPRKVKDFYEFFGLQELKPFIETTLANYAASVAPKRAPAATTPRRRKSPNETKRKKPAADE